VKDQDHEHYWSRYAEGYDGCAEYVVTRALREAITDQLLQEGHPGKVLECGCGTGYYTTAIAQHAQLVIATDLSEDMMRVARRHLKDCVNIILCKVDCQRIPFPAASFDTVLMANVLHAITSPMKALQECYRVLKLGGSVIVICYSDFSMDWLDRMALAIRYLEMFKMPPPQGLKNYTPHELFSLVGDAGFIVKDIKVLGDKPQALYLKGRKAQRFKRKP
jgi:ABC-2 type transport system ATP-binding protein